ncbi:hypothetical protein ENUP19_0347G0006 [Entamoeba nuttalli]|uniref:Leucine rich repeat protein, BspA family protein n=2 Tax=Entamoeba nuttalli TaxID=412467 RepID=K2GUD5_ENTNP|nr:leucine rich repeat protein, BspA family protein [Entamoeba nuttalli P19]EKE38633.1 leucine rich repeat protein, BspA family protein [Entamoeba nuttalli P19]|eukprot:XP_008859029.1 leucine rich repeat protein, BspA family protein [Entamoeba nuttalli P19]
MSHSQVDPYSMMIISKYFATIDDFKNIQMVNKKYSNLMSKFHYNPVSLTVKTRKYFPKLQTLCLYNRKDELFNDRRIKTIKIYYEVSYEECNRKVKDNVHYCHVYYSSRDLDTFGKNIPTKVCEIKEYCFSGFDLKKNCLIIPTNITSLKPSSFSDCLNLTHISIPSSVVSIGRQCFINCYELESISLPPSVSFLGSDCFSDCYNLTGVTISSSIDRLGSYIFWDCYNLKELEIPNVLITVNQKVLFGDIVLNGLLLPKSVKRLNKHNFITQTSLTSFEIPNSFTGIGTYCFSDCTNLTQLSIPSTICYFGQSCFKGCSSHLKIIGNVPQNIFI